MMASHGAAGLSAISRSRGGMLNWLFMKLRHAAALALVGWYLMIPPIVRPPGREGTADTKAPLSKWVKVIRSAFDSEDACHIALQRFQFSIQSNYQSALGQALTEPEFQRIEQASSAKCIAFDASRRNGD